MFFIFVVILSIFCHSDLKAIIEKVNSNPKSTWTAGENYLLDYSITQLKSLTNLRDTVQTIPTGSLKLKSGNGTANFDSRKKWPGCVHPIRNQGACGACWAFSITESLSDRFCIVSNYSVDVVLSPQRLVSCDPFNLGCSGGIPPIGWQLMELIGTVKEECIPYISGKDGDRHIEICVNVLMKKCTAKKQKYKTYFSKGFQQFTADDVDGIMEEMEENGPMQCSMDVYEDFISYEKGIYTHLEGELLGGHAIKCIGWGTTDEGLEYWIMANSWTEGWGMEGFFFIAKGQNECGIEEGFIAGTPKYKPKN